MIEIKRSDAVWWGMYVTSGEEERRGCRLVIMLPKRWIQVSLPPLIKPYRHWVDTSRYSWAGPNGGYWGEDRREYGFSLMEGHLSVMYGRQGDSSLVDKRWGCFLPWTDWRFVRYSVYGLQGEHLATSWEGRTMEERRSRFDEERAMAESAPKVQFDFRDYDGEEIQATTFIVEREWRFGTGWFKWLSLFRRPKVRRSLDIRFSKEVGPKKGSWKGGILGHGINMEPGELHEQAFRRYCAEHNLTLIGVNE